MLQLRLMEKKHELVRRADVDELIDGICGVTLTHLSGMSRVAVATCRSGAPSTRWWIAAVCLAKADEWNEPPLNEQ